MTIEELKAILEATPNRKRTHVVKKMSKAIELLDNLYPGVLLNHQVYALINEKSPYCAVCSSVLNDVRKNTCSYACREQTIDQSLKSQKQKETLVAKYGVTNIRHVRGAEYKRTQTFLQKYGSLVSPLTAKKAKIRVPDLIRKGRETLKKKYGVENPGQLPDHYKKCTASHIKKTGHSHYSHSEKYQEELARKRLGTYISLCPSSIIISQIIDPPLHVQKSFTNPNYRVQFSCTTCNKEETIPSETFKFRMRSAGTCCKTCGEFASGSLQEKSLKDFIESELAQSVLSNTRTVISPMELDIFIPDKRLAIEYNGLYWHNEKLLEKNYHWTKTNLATEKQINLIHIFEDEWIHKPEIVKSRLRYLLGKTKNTIHARKCVIKEVSNKVVKEFLTENHLQGFAPSAIKLGLFYNDELISIMTFSKLNISKGHKHINNHWELSRFCSKINTNVPGAAAKLFKHFTSYYLPEQIISFSDNRWGKGSVYKKLGFVYENMTGPNYWYIDLANVKRLHRFSLRKTEKDDRTKTEKQLRSEQGYLRIWDCGSTKWIWKRAG